MHHLVSYSYSKSTLEVYAFCVSYIPNYNYYYSSIVYDRSFRVNTSKIKTYAKKISDKINFEEDSDLHQSEWHLEYLKSKQWRIT